MNYLNKQFDKAITKGNTARKRKAAVKMLTPEEKVSVIKQRYGLVHGGTKQNKKKRKKGRK